MEPVREATIGRAEHGAVVQSDGWFVLNAADARWTRNDHSGEWCDFESPDAPFRDFGANIHVLQPGRPNGLYHAESAQEGFLVLSGECICLVEGEERPLRAWDTSTVRPVRVTCSSARALARVRCS